MEFKIDMKLGTMIFLNMAPPQKLVLAPGAIFVKNTVFVWMSAVFPKRKIQDTLIYHQEELRESFSLD